MTNLENKQENIGLQVKLKADGWKIAAEVPTERIVEIELTAPAANTQQDSPPLNLGLVIDRSGSMGGGKLEQAKMAVAQILDLMREKDSVSIVAYDDSVRIVAESNSVTPSERKELKTSLNSVHTGGSTNLGGGWLQGCQCVAHRQDSAKVNRTLLLSDGLANVGITDPAELSRHASEIFERGVATSTFGIGEGFNEHLMEALANRGGGNFYHIDQTRRIPELLMQEFKDLASVTLKNTVIRVVIPTGTKVELFGEWRSEKRGNELIFYLSDLAANRTVNLFLKLLTAPALDNLDMQINVAGKGESDEILESNNVLHLTRAPEEEANKQTLDMELLQHFSSVAVGQLSNEALKLERAGRLDEAKQLMDEVMGKFRPMMAETTRSRYDKMTSEIGEGFNEQDRKNWNSDSYLLKKHRHDEQRRDPNKKTP